MTAPTILPAALTMPSREKSPRRHLVICPTCEEPLLGLLAGCGDTRCTSEECRDEKALDLRIEATDE